VDASTYAAPGAKPGRFLHRFANPGRFLRLAARVQPFLTWPALLLTALGLGWGLFFSPADWQQGDAVRIMYIHVPSAILAEGGYWALAAASLIALVWRHPLADLAAAELSPIGAAVTALCLATGSLWGKPMWGAWWVWDARLTSVLVLFFLYIGHIMVVRAFVDLPIIKYSVVWWNTLHQAASITLTGAPTMDGRMLWPLGVAALGISLGFGAVLTANLRAAVMERRIAGLLLAKADRAA
jgi:heme exporter protein C